MLNKIENSQFRIIKGGKEEDTYGLGDPCVPLEISYPKEDKRNPSSLKYCVPNKDFKK